jgi:hypothetical protein
MQEICGASLGFHNKELWVLHLSCDLTMDNEMFADHWKYFSISILNE